MSHAEPGRQAHAVPSVGRIVHYVAHGPRCLPAWVCEVDRESGLVALFVVDAELGTSNGATFKRGVVSDEDAKAPGTWHWPELV